jgi:predicted MFS family arabinose efflux permease
MSGAFLLLTYYYQVVRGLTALDTGLAFLPLSLGGMLGSSLVARRLSARMAPRRLVAGALSFAALGLLLLSRAGAASPYLWHFAPAELILGVGIGSAMMPVFSLATLAVEPHNAGLASALVSAAQQLGGGIGAALLNALALVAGYGWAGCGGAALLAAAALCAWGLPAAAGQFTAAPRR